MGDKESYFALVLSSISRPKGFGGGGDGGTDKGEVSPCSHRGITDTLA